MRKCKACGTDIDEWLNRFKGRAKIWLDKLYFDENKTSYKEDDHGLYISGDTFYEIEAKKAKARCPRCGFKVKQEVEMDEVTWAPI